MTTTTASFDGGDPFRRVVSRITESLAPDEGDSSRTRILKNVAQGAVVVTVFAVDNRKEIQAIWEKFRHRNA